MTDVDSEIRTVRFDPLGVQIVSEGGQEPDMNPQQTQVMRNVPANTAKADGDLARIGIPRDQRPDGLSADSASSSCEIIGFSSIQFRICRSRIVTFRTLS